MHITLKWASLLSLLSFLSVSTSAVAQFREPPSQWGPPHRPLIKLIGYVNAQPPEHPAYPPLILAVPGVEERISFVLTDMKIMAGPLRTPGSIIDEVEPYSTNFYLRVSPEAATRIVTSPPDEQLTILAEYSSGNRVLLVQSVEHSTPQKTG